MFVSECEGGFRMANFVAGSGWEQLRGELEAELRSLDATAVLAPTALDADGLPRFRARFAPEARAAGRRLLRAYEEQAIAICEVCGHEGRVYAGPVLRVRCPTCCD